MLQIKIKTIKDSELKELEKPVAGCWIDAVKPNKEERKFLREEIGIPTDFILSSLDEDERPRIEKELDKILIIIRVPCKRKKNGEVEVATVPLGIIITRKYFVTISLLATEVLQDFHEEKVNFYTTQKTRFLLQILKRTNRYYARYLDEIEKRIREIEASVFRSLKNEEIIQLLRFQKTLIYFNGSIIANEKVFEKIAGGKVITLFKQDEELLEDIVIDNRELMENVRIFSEILSNTLDAYASIVSNNMNIVMKFLTSFTIILSIPTIVSSIYGMNIALPFQQHPQAFLIVMAITLAIVVGFVILFWKKDWF
ncbi:MAG: magnesium transporter CorA family protein [Candidatus Aenigmarchaeota archaeon]|nr:magnesium transporter CorA family protein [Candidatus Aenigmarchaeota archaeon]